MTEYIREFSGRILGSIETDSNGDQIARNFSGRILGYYRKNRNVTTNFAGKILVQGNAVVSFLVHLDP